VDVDVVYGFLHFDVMEADIYGTGKPPFAHIGVGILDAEWGFEPTGAGAPAAPKIAEPERMPSAT